MPAGVEVSPQPRQRSLLLANLEASIPSDRQPIIAQYQARGECSASVAYSCEMSSRQLQSARSHAVSVLRQAQYH